MPRSTSFSSLSWVLGLSLVYGCVQSPAFAPVNPPASPKAQNNPSIEPSINPLATPSARPEPTPSSPLASPSASLAPLPSPSASPDFSLSAEALAKLKAHPLTEANNAFSWKLFRQTFAQAESENHFMSGLSATLALQMVLAGTEGKARQEMLDILALKAVPEAQLTDDIPLFIQRLIQNSDVRLDIANSIWANPSFTLQPEWLQTLQTQFQAEADTVDFTKKSGVDRINQWVSDKTQGKINAVLNYPLEAPKSIIYALLNAVYFKGSWTYEFDPTETTTKPFYLTPTQLVNVEMMRQFNQFAYRLPNELFPHQAVALPYGKKQSVKMYIFLPSFDKTLPQLIQDLDRVGFDSLVKQFGSERGSLRLPKFTIEKNMDLKVTLEAMGASKMLKAGLDFKGLLPPASETYLSKINQKSVIEVNEKGTEAAVATTVVSNYSSSEPLRSMDMTVNSPFFFLIRDEETSQILFMGSVTNPLENL